MGEEEYKNITKIDLYQAPEELEVYNQAIHNNLEAHDCIRMKVEHDELQEL